MIAFTATTGHSIILFNKKLRPERFMNESERNRPSYRSCYGIFSATEEKTMQHSAKHSRNVLDPKKRLYVVSNHKMYTSKKAICGVLSQFPETVHDPTSFSVDVLKNDVSCLSIDLKKGSRVLSIRVYFFLQKKSLVLIVDGVYKEPSRDSIVPERYFRFRRTWIFRANAKSNTTTEYFITNEMLNIGFAPNDVVKKYFKVMLLK